MCPPFSSIAGFGFKPQWHFSWIRFKFLEFTNEAESVLTLVLTKSGYIILFIEVLI